MHKRFQIATKGFSRALLVPVAAAALIGSALPAAAATSGDPAPPVSSTAATHIKNLRTPWGGTGRCLEDTLADGLRAEQCSDADSQLWTPDSEKPGLFKNESTGRCLDDSVADGLRTLECYGESYTGGYQHWSADTLIPYYKVAELRNGNTGRCIDDSFEFGLRPRPCSHGRYMRGFQAWSFSGS